jgi:hypothetical protein
LYVGCSFIVCRMFLYSLAITTFLTRSVELIFSILLQHRISKLPGIFYLFSIVSECQHNTKLYFKCRTSFVFFFFQVQFTGEKNLLNYWTINNVSESVPKQIKNKRKYEILHFTIIQIITVTFILRYVSLV